MKYRQHSCYNSYQQWSNQRDEFTNTRYNTEDQWAGHSQESEAQGADQTNEQAGS